MAMIVAGLTGGIATGKSTVAGILSEAGAHIVDADGIAREVLARGTPGFEEVVAHFGPGILASGGGIDRRRLAAAVFSDAAERRVLEGIVHPRVRQESAGRLDAIARRHPHAVAVLEVPLLFESGMDRGLEGVIVVYVPEPVQIRRLMTRDGFTEAEAAARIRAQMPIERKKQLATWVIDNTGSLAHTREQTLAVHRRLALRAAGEEPDG
jgi:dephospho-CoA kinase